MGADMDSYFEYLLKSHIMFGEEEDYLVFNESYNGFQQYLRKGRTHCNPADCASETDLSYVVFEK